MHHLSHTAFKMFPADQNIVLNSDTTHHLPSLFLKSSQNFQISFQIASECTNHRPYFQKNTDCGRTAYFTPALMK